MSCNYFGGNTGTPANLEDAYIPADMKDNVPQTLARNTTKVMDSGRDILVLV